MSTELPCDCCEGADAVTPGSTANRFGLSSLGYRMGTHASFMESMQARLATQLEGLRTRARDDASMALLDSWAAVADVLTFYQERIANEGFLRTATERRSVLELARLIGYSLRPGVSATTFLAFNIEKDAAPVEIPAGTRANSVPGPDEQMQAFETADPLAARYEWNELKPRLTQPQTAESIEANGLYLKGISTQLKVNDPLLLVIDGKEQFRRIASITADAEHDRTLLTLHPVATPATAIDRVKAIIAKFEALDRFGVSPSAVSTKRTLKMLAELSEVIEKKPEVLASHIESVTLPHLEAELKALKGHPGTLFDWTEKLFGEMKGARQQLQRLMSASTGAPRNEAAAGGAASLLKSRDELLGTLLVPPSVPPASNRELARSPAQAFATRADTFPRLLAALRPPLQRSLYSLLRNAIPPGRPTGVEVYALRVSAAPFGHNAALAVSFDDGKIPHFAEWEIDEPLGPAGIGRRAELPPPYHDANLLLLDNEYNISPESRVVIERSGGTALITNVQGNVVQRSLTAYGLSGKSTQLTLGTKWIDAENEDFFVVRDTRVYAGSERLELADEPMTDPVEGAAMELGALYEDLEPGRWLIVAGERADIAAGDTAVRGIRAAELAMLASVEQRTRLVGEDNFGFHTFIGLAEELAYKYKRDTVKIYGNVVKATHGETRQEVLGAGDAAKSLQEFALKQPPLTYVSAPTPSGVESTLEVRVNDVKWHEAESLAALGPNDRKYITRTDDEAKTAVVFGNGERGARLPTGQENVKATYRNGIGKGGNVRAGQISLLATRPLGVKDVVNPIRATGGADRDSRDQARRNAPLAVMALDRLVSTIDYADFARTFAGIGKAAAARLTDGRRQVVHVTVAGVDDGPIEETSDLYRNLLAALRNFGDPHLPVELALRSRLALVVSARVRIHPDHLWDVVEPKLRSAMLEAFGFERLELGTDLLLSEAIRAMQSVAGVTYVDVDVFDTISETQLLEGLLDAPATLARQDRISIATARVGDGVIEPAQLAYLTAEVADTLILQELKS
jgi:predicted phage baseplate assembly protein